MRLELRYCSVIPKVYHADLVVSDDQGIRGYWAGPEDAINKFASPFLETTIGFFQAKNYNSFNRSFVSNPDYNQLIADNLTPEIEEQIVARFQEIANAQIPYYLWGPNSNSAAFQVLRSILYLQALAPPQHIFTPGWKLNPFHFSEIDKYFYSARYWF